LLATAILVIDTFARFRFINRYRAQLVGWYSLDLTNYCFETSALSALLYDEEDTFSKVEQTASQVVRSSYI